MAMYYRSLTNICSKAALPKQFVHTVTKVLPRCMSSMPDIKSENLKVAKCLTPKEKPTDIGNIEFGTVFTDHMLSIKWSNRDGWQDPEITPYGDIALNPAAKVFHYSIEGFEGMKAYFCPSDRSVRLFRPMENVRRLQRTGERLCLPNFSGDEFLKCLVELVKIDKDWIPQEDSCSLYIRPTFIGTAPTLGVNVANEALLYCILSPVGPYFKTGSFKPVSLLADPRFVRSWHGGCGDSKAGGNYAPTLFAQAEATKQKCEQVLWLYGDDRQITEVGTMNMFLFLENEDGEEELVTPPLDGLILPGITRMSMLDLARQWDEFKVSERRYTMDDLMKALKEQRVKEVFGAGTACVVCPVKDILYENQVLKIPTTENGPGVAKKFYDELTGIQYGKIPSPWSVVVSNENNVEYEEKLRTRT